MKFALSIIRDGGFEKYRLPDDGRQWKHLCAQRQRLTLFLVSYANPEGTDIMVGVGEGPEDTRSSMCRFMGLTRRAVQYLLDDLKALGILADCGKSRFQGTTNRKLLLNAFVQSSAVQPCNLQAPIVQTTEANVQSSQPKCAIEDCAQPPRSDHQKQTTTPTTREEASEKSPTPVQGGGGGNLLSPTKVQDSTVQSSQPWDWLFSEATVAGMGAANKYWGRLQKLGNSETVRLAVLKFCQRPQGLDKLKHPWPMFLKEASTWLERVKGDREKAVQEKAAQEAAEMAGRIERYMQFRIPDLACPPQDSSYEAVAAAIRKHDGIVGAMKNWARSKRAEFEAVEAALKNWTRADSEAFAQHLGGQLCKEPGCEKLACKDGYCNEHEPFEF